MKQSGNRTQSANLQEFLDSAANAATYGQRQFYTPPSVAESLFRPLPAVRKDLVADLHFGNGALATGSKAKVALGLDIDARVRDELKPPAGAKWHVEHADLTLWYSIAVEADLRLPFITINPPFSLLWHTSRLGELRRSLVPEVATEMTRHGEHIDSTLASFMIALDRLCANGEGFMVCNGKSARRLIGDPEKPEGSPLMKYVWLWLEIPSMIFDNQATDFPTAVLYFSKSHASSHQLSTLNSQPLFLRTTTGDAASVDSALMVPEVFTAHKGYRLRYADEFNPAGTIEKFRTIATEYAARHRGNTPDWNIRIDEQGRLRTHLTPFQRVSTFIPSDLVIRLNELNLQTPISLCVTATSRTALREAAACEFWRIQPEVHQAIAAAMNDFEAEGAPFYTPNKTQALGWVDEYSALTCNATGIGTIQPGDSCPITCTIEPTAWTGQRINLAGEAEDLEYKGKELLVRMIAPGGCEHHFHVRRDDAEIPPQINTATGKARKMHWHISDLIEHFDIPIPQDITQLRPQEYHANLRVLDALEARVNANTLRRLGGASRSPSLSN